MRKACVRPSGMTVRDLLGNEAFSEAVLGNTGVGAAKILDKG